MVSSLVLLLQTPNEGSSQEVVDAGQRTRPLPQEVPQAVSRDASRMQPKNKFSFGKLLKILLLLVILGGAIYLFLNPSSLQGSVNDFFSRFGAR